MPELLDVRVLKELVGATTLHRRLDDATLREEMVEAVSPQQIRDRLARSHRSSPWTGPRFGRTWSSQPDEDVFSRDGESDPRRAK